ncbi:MAG: PorT family protein [Paludibacter sp.]|nr:PorT family protein [Paludibacter sp.]
MQNEIENTKQPDAFSESIRTKLENHSLPLDPNGWSDLQARMNAGKTKKMIPFWFWFSGGAAVAVIALLFILRPFSKQSELVSKFESPKQEVQHEVILPGDSAKEVTIIKGKEDSSSEKLVPHSKSIKILETEIAESTSVPKGNHLKNKTLKTQFNTLKATPIYDDNNVNIQPEATDLVENSKTDENNGNLAETVNVETQKSNVNSSTPTERILPNSLLNEPVKDEPIVKNKIKNELLLAAAFGSGGSTSVSGGGPNEFLALEVSKRQLTKAETNYTSILTPNDFSQQTFLAPLSFGLVVRKNIGNSIGIETGLVYTYLLSTFEEHTHSNYDAQLTLHYLGIPLNLIVPLWKDQQWEVYLSGGGMVEKGLRSIYIQNQYFGNQIITTDARTKIEGLQWSANAAMGITYKLQRNIGIYFEPKFSYFFENKQPVSARTDQPIVVGLTAGLRYKF